MPKQRIHREWFRTVLCGGRKSCPRCGNRLPPNESIWSWGQYVRGKWRTITHFCRSCWSGIADDLVAHQSSCPDNCEIQLIGYHTDLPDWMALGLSKSLTAKE